MIDIYNVVGSKEIAIRANVRHDTVYKWLERHLDFPEPVVELTMGRIWDWKDVEAWLKQTDRLGTKRRN